MRHLLAWLDRRHARVTRSYVSKHRPPLSPTGAFTTIRKQGQP